MSFGIHALDVAVVIALLLIHACLIAKTRAERTSSQKTCTRTNRRTGSTAKGGP